MMIYPQQPEAMDMIQAHLKLSSYAELQMEYNLATVEFLNQKKRNELYLTKLLLLATLDKDTDAVKRYTEQIVENRKAKSDIMMSALSAKLKVFMAANPNLA
jgi:energy-converting hydrogenase A subunit M